MIRVIAVVAAALVLWATPQLAAADCIAYGATAAQQQRDNTSLKCGFKGPRWHENAGAHAAFCAAAGDAVAASETALRAGKLTECRRAAGGQDQDARRCRKSGVAEGAGTTIQRARGAARDQLARTRAQYLNRGFTQCRYNDLGCSGPNGARTCFLSISCCRK